MSKYGDMPEAKVKALREYEYALGPWLPEDLATDVLCDIRALDFSDDVPNPNGITLADVVAWLALSR
jgi:hypothetical protein